MDAKTKTNRKQAARRPPDSYFSLVNEFPLVPLKDEAHLDAAEAMLRRLLKLDRDSGEEDYLLVLTDLIEAYEDEHVVFPEAPEGDVLAEFMRGHGLTQAAFAKATGIAQSTISAVINGKRSLTRTQIKSISRHFQVPTAIFLRD
jgi:HTH-type transcriptional regulator/antitoxin HigA